MIFGKTYKERRQADQKRLEYYFEWHDYFAILPVRLKNGRWVWLETVLRRDEDIYISNLGGYEHYTTWGEGGNWQFIEKKND